MKQNIKEGIIRNALDNIANKGYQEYKQGSTILDVFKGNGFKAIDMEENRGYRIYYVVRDTNMIRYAQDTNGMPINELIEDVNVFLEDNYSNLEASEVRGNKDTGIAIMIKNRNYTGPTPPPVENLDSDEEVDQIAEMVSRVVKKTLNEVVISELPEDEQIQWAYNEIMNACRGLVRDGRYTGRRFNSSILNKLEEVDGEYASLKEELLGSMQATFENAKRLMVYCHGKSSEEYDKEQARGYFDSEWTPNWE